MRACVMYELDEKGRPELAYALDCTVGIRFFLMNYLSKKHD